MMALGMANYRLKGWPPPSDAHRRAFNAVDVFEDEGLLGAKNALSIFLDFDEAQRQKLGKEIQF